MTIIKATTKTVVSITVFLILWSVVSGTIGYFIGNYNKEDYAKEESVKTLISAREKGLITFNKDVIFEGL